MHRFRSIVPRLSRSSRFRALPISTRQFSIPSNAVPLPEDSSGLLCARGGDLYHVEFEIIEPVFKIIDTTLREGEQFATTFFEDKRVIAQMLDDLGVEYIEVMNPLASAQTAKDCEIISSMGLKAKIASHVRCNMVDVKEAINRGITVIHMYMATSPALKKFSHGKNLREIIEAAKEAITYCKERNVEVRFSCEDTFRSDLADLLEIYSTLSEFGVDRIGLADTVGVASPLQVLDTVRRIARVVTCEIGYHTHNDTGCCIANALLALQGGVTHIDTSVLGIGERNGITPLGGFLARMYTYNAGYKSMIIERYNLRVLKPLEEYVSHCAGVDIPFNNYVTGWSAFTHKAGVHSKAVLQNPSSYEVICPDDFGVSRDIKLAHRLTGWNAVGERSTQLGLDLSESSIKEAAKFIKTLADTKKVDLEMLDKALQNVGGGRPVNYGIQG
uniref:Homocitrate synthase n=1 Tax=Hirondellea gigas TaxID=1518452 RepID=A0A2P2ICF3_9CRUS